MTTLIAHITIKQGTETQFESIMEDMVKRTLTEETGVLRYEYFKGQAPNFYYCLLSFKDKWAFYHHQNSEHHEGHDFGAVIERIELEYVDPVTKANPLPKTIDAALEPHHDESLHRANRLYPIAIPDWWTSRQ